MFYYAAVHWNVIKKSMHVEIHVNVHVHFKNIVLVVTTFHQEQVKSHAVQYSC